MAVVQIRHRPKLTVEKAIEKFQKHFGPKYIVQETNTWGRDFTIEKSEWVGVIVKLKQEKNKTSFVFTYFIPNNQFRFIALFLGLFAWPILRPKGQALENEVKSFIQSAEGFK